MSPSPSPRPRKPEPGENEPAGVKRLTLLSQGNVVGFGMIFPDGWTRLDFLEGFSGYHHIQASHLPYALKKAWSCLPDLDWAWVGHA